MANLVITIGRENGSGGRQLGSELAAALGVKCYDSELINETAKASGFAKSFVETHEEHRPGSFLYSLVTGGGVISDEQPFPVQIFQAQSEVIRTIAARESCVIVGRCADHVLRDFSNRFDFFIHGSIEDRVKRIQSCGDYEIEGKTPQAALEKMDKQRSTYYNYYTGKVWGKCDHYDLCINAGRLGVEYSTDIILEYINRLKK